MAATNQPVNRLIALTTKYTEVPQELMERQQQLLPDPSATRNAITLNNTENYFEMNIDVVIEMQEREGPTLEAADCEEIVFLIDSEASRDGTVAVCDQLIQRCAGNQGRIQATWDEPAICDFMVRGSMLKWFECISGFHPHSTMSSQQKIRLLMAAWSWMWSLRTWTTRRVVVITECCDARGGASDLAIALLCMRDMKLNRQPSKKPEGPDQAEAGIMTLARAVQMTTQGGSRTTDSNGYVLTQTEKREIVSVPPTEQNGPIDKIQYVKKSGNNGNRIRLCEFLLGWMAGMHSLTSVTAETATQCPTNGRCVCSEDHSPACYNELHEAYWQTADSHYPLARPGTLGYCSCGKAWNELFSSGPDCSVFCPSPSECHARPDMDSSGSRREGPFWWSWCWSKSSGISDSTSKSVAATPTKVVVVTNTVGVHSTINPTSGDESAQVKSSDTGPLWAALAIAIIVICVLVGLIYVMYRRRPYQPVPRPMPSIAAIPNIPNIQISNKVSNTVNSGKQPIENEEIELHAIPAT